MSLDTDPLHMPTLLPAPECPPRSDGSHLPGRSTWEKQREHVMEVLAQEGSIESSSQLRDHSVIGTDLILMRSSHQGR